MKPQRYYINELPNGGYQLLADDSGEWVKWDDVERLLAPPRGRVIEGWAVVERNGVPVAVELSIEGAEDMRNRGDSIVPCLIEILAAPSAKEE